MNIKIRPFKISDTAAVEALLSEIVQVHYAVRPDIFRPNYKNEQTNWEENADAPVFVATDDYDNVLGCLWCIIMHERGNSLKIDRDWLCIDDICVDEKYRKHGIGQKLLDFACHLAMERGLHRIELNVYNDNLNAVRFYKQFGFKTQKRVMEFDIPAADTPGQETDEERQARIYPIILSEYNPAWAEWFTQEKADLERLIGVENIARISHFGSTSVPGLTAKPTVDILLEIKKDANINKLIDALSSSEYIYLHQESASTILAPPLHLMFLKGYLHDGFAEKVYHIHVVRPGDWDEKLCFKDYLISHPETAAEYAALKRSLFKDYEHNHGGYTEAKTEFILAVTEKARKEINRRTV